MISSSLALLKYACVTNPARRPWLDRRSNPPAVTPASAHPGPQDKALRVHVQGNLTDPEEVVRVSAQHNVHFLSLPLVG